MKQRDVIFAALAVVILLVAGYLAYTQLLPQKSGSSKTVTVEKVGEIPSELNADGLKWIEDGQKVVDYNSPFDLTGLGNTAPFGH